MSASTIRHKGTLNLDFPLQIGIAISHRCLRLVLNQPVLFGFRFSLFRTQSPHRVGAHRARCRNIHGDQ
jgi:hypothetical protein